MMLVCTTLLCTPARNSPTMARLERENQGCSQRDVRNDTWAVAGSPNQYTAPTATQTDTTTNTNLHLSAVGWLDNIISVNLRSNAFRSSQATCSKLDMMATLRMWMNLSTCNLMSLVEVNQAN